MFKRRKFITGAIADSLAAPAALVGAPQGTATFGLIGKISALPERRDDLIQILAEGTRKMPGCTSYLISRDLSDQNGIWITELWSDEDAHRASLALPQVKKAIEHGKPLIASFDSRIKIEPAAGM